MKIYFVRHGETKMNFFHLLMGSRINEQLDKKGIAQAHEVAQHLDPAVNIIFASPLKRAQQTAFIISNARNISVHTRDELAERDFGKLTGKSWDEIQEMTGVSLENIEENLNMNLRKFDVEPGSAMKARLLHFLADIKKNYSDKVPLIVAHSGIINLMYQMYPETQHPQAANGTIHVFEI
ncbi:phosphoglycerate mutase family protein [Patescibacteria group bacterium]|nr:phosphoglycerate mutase family protein [Patescibacteria group bacterium]